MVAGHDTINTYIHAHSPTHTVELSYPMTYDGELLCSHQMPNDVCVGVTVR